jgi:integrase
MKSRELTKWREEHGYSPIRAMGIHAGQNTTSIQTQMGHARINRTLDIHGHLVNAANLNRQQAGLWKILSDPFEIS